LGTHRVGTHFGICRAKVGLSAIQSVTRCLSIVVFGGLQTTGIKKNLKMPFVKKLFWIKTLNILKWQAVKKINLIKKYDSRKICTSTMQ
jgi:hypothetical protein